MQHLSSCSMIDPSSCVPPEEQAAADVGRCRPPFSKPLSDLTSRSCDSSGLVLGVAAATPAIVLHLPVSLSVCQGATCPRKTKQITNCPVGDCKDQCGKVTGYLTGQGVHRLIGDVNACEWCLVHTSLDHTRHDVINVR
jgi:hypothetical protein